jgi:hypothetical protein
MDDYGIKRVPIPGLRVTDPPLFSACMAKGCPETGVHDWVEVVADLGIMVAGKICDAHKEYLEALARRNILVEWVAGA